MRRLLWYGNSSGSDRNPNSPDNPVCLSVQSYGTYCQHHASFRSWIIVYNLHLAEFNFFSQIEKTKRMATNAMRVAWTEISAIDAFSSRFAVSIFKNPKVALLVESRWEMRDKDGARVWK
jgi:hypothetical protein